MFVIGGGDSVVPSLIQAAHDDRWRTREGLVLGLQRAGERSSDPVVRLVATWARSGDPFLERAAISVLAHNPLLKDRPTALLAIDLSGEIIDRLQSIAPALRKTEGNRILQKALGFAISMFVAAAPEVGFEAMERWIVNGDEVTRRIISENLGKARLSTRYPTEVARLKGVHFEIDDWER